MMFVFRLAFTGVILAITSGVASGQTLSPTIPSSIRLENIEGRVRKTDGSGLLVISIGEEDGLVKGSTLQIFRLSQAKYLGVIRIISVEAHCAVAQPVGKLLGPVREGDNVARSILPRPAPADVEERTNHREVSHRTSADTSETPGDRLQAEENVRILRTSFPIPSSTEVDEEDEYYKTVRYEQQMRRRVHGEVTKVEASGVIELSIGSADGLRPGRRLQVYRNRPALYLGIVRVISVTPHSARAKPVDPLSGTMQQGDVFLSPPVTR